jgi:5-methylcytosine-specific restriction enzyme A
MFNSGIRLNAGQVEVLWLDGDCRVLFHGPIALRTSKRFSVLCERKPIYPAVPAPSGVCSFASENIESIPNIVWKRHEQFIDDAVEAKAKTPHKQSFSEGVLRHLELLIHTALPRPAYIQKHNAPSKATPVSLSEIDELPSASEAQRKLVSHFRLERNRALVKRKMLSYQEETGGLACEICKFDFSKYGSLGVGFCEVHHLKPLSAELSEVRTNLIDLAVVCSNCHRMIHRNGKCRALSEVKAALHSHHC